MEKNNTLAIYEAIEVLDKKIKDKEISLNLNGHFPHCEKDEHSMNRILSKVSMGLLSDNRKSPIIDIIIDVVNGNLKKDIPLIKFPSFDTCETCGNELMLWFNGDSLYFKESCQEEKLPFSVNFPAPTGKLVMLDSLNDYFTVNDSFDVNIFHGLKDTTHAYIKEHMFHTFVGNSCPSFGTIGTEKNELVFGEINEDISQGSICTDLWWISVVDESILKLRLEAMDYDEKEINQILDSLERTTVSKGWYNATSNFAAYSYDDDIYAYFTLERDIEEDFIDKVKSEIANNKKIKNKNQMNNDEEPTIEIINSLEDTKPYKFFYNDTYSFHSKLSLPSLLDLFYGRDSHSNNKHNWIPYQYDTNSDNYAQSVAKEIDLKSIKEDMTFYTSIPVIKKYLLLLNEPDFRRYERFKKIEPSIIGNGSSSNSYPYDISKFELVYIFMYYKSLLDNIEDEIIFKPSLEKSSKQDLIEFFEFNLNLAFTNIKLRGMEKEMNDLFIDINDNRQDFINGISPSIFYTFDDKLTLPLMQLKAVDKTDKEIEKFKNEIIQGFLDS
jgi:hypothetical protein